MAKRLFWLTLAAALVVPSKARARTKAYRMTEVSPPPQKQSRRRAERPRVQAGLAAIPSPCGRHVAKVTGGAIYVDGKRVHPDRGTVYLLAAPRWRRDGRALAWLERHQGATRLIVLADLDQPIAWSLPPLPGGDQVFWAGASRVIVGPTMFQPRAVASWTQ